MNETKAICKKCGYDLSYCKPFDPFYCNEYCCNPCCPEAYKSPCLKERWEKVQKKIKNVLKDDNWEMTNKIMEIIIKAKEKKDDKTNI